MEGGKAFLKKAVNASLEQVDEIKELLPFHMLVLSHLYITTAHWLISLQSMYTLNMPVHACCYSNFSEYQEYAIITCKMT